MLLNIYHKNSFFFVCEKQSHFFELNNGVKTLRDVQIGTQNFVLELKTEAQFLCKQILIFA